jgi:predicted aspartyl protease
MGFEPIGREAYVLADGQVVRADIYKAEILWFNRSRSVEVIALDNRQGLLGTQLLQACRLTIHFGKRTVNIREERK